MATEPPDKKSEHPAKPDTPRKSEASIEAAMSAVQAGMTSTQAPPSSQQNSPTNQKHTDVSHGAPRQGTINIKEEVLTVLKKDEDASVANGNQVESTPQRGNFWILAIDPEVYDFHRRASPEEFISLNINLPEQLISVGDQILCWLSGDNSGIHGWLEIFEINGKESVDFVLNNKFRFPIPNLLTKKLIGTNHPLFEANHANLFDCDEVTFFDILFEAGRFGNRLPRYSATNLDAALSEETIKENEWLEPLKENMLDHGFTVFSLWQMGVYFRTQGLPSTDSKENDIYQQGLTLFVITDEGISFSGLTYQFKLLGQEALADEYLKQLQDIFPNTTLKDAPTSGDRDLVGLDGNPIPLGGPNFDWKNLVRATLDLEIEIQTNWEKIKSIFEQWEKDPDTRTINQFSDKGAGAEGLQFAHFALTDSWTTEDLLGYRDYALAASEFLNDERTKAPLAISIQAPWGAGKTSLMKMIQQELDPGYEAIKNSSISARTSYKQVTGALKKLGKPEADVQGHVTASPQGWISVWFNPWKYEESDQIWAGLADTIIRDFADRMSPGERELFYLDLNLRRIDSQALRNDIHKAMLTTTARWSFSCAALAVGVLAGIGDVIADSGVLGFLTQHLASTGVVGGALGAIAGYIKKNGESAASALPEYIRIPNYSEKLGFRQTAAEDIACVFRGHRDRDGVPAKIVIFIDDLDRCSPKKIANVFEAINHFVADRDLKCFVVLGMDGEIVSAALKKHYKDLFEEVPSNSRSSSIGWYYLDKFVQIPFVIPITDKDRLLALAQNAGKHQETPDNSETIARPTPIPPARRVYSKLLRFLSLLYSPFPYLGSGFDRFSRRMSARQHTKAIQEISEFSLASLQQNDDSADKRQWLEQKSKQLTNDELLQNIWDIAQWNFNNNPRTVKRCVNLTRFFYLIHGLRLKDGQPVPDKDALVRWIYFAFRWPDAARWVQSSKSTSPEDNEAPETLSKKRIAQLYNGARAADNETTIWNSDTDLGQEHLAQHPWIADDDLMAFCRDHFLHIQQHAGKGFW